MTAFVTFCLALYVHLTFEMLPCQYVHLIGSAGEPEPAGGAEYVPEDSGGGCAAAADEPGVGEAGRPHPDPPAGAAALHPTLGGQRPQVRHQRG